MANIFIYRLTAMGHQFRSTMLCSSLLLSSGCYSLTKTFWLWLQHYQSRN